MEVPKRDQLGQQLFFTISLMAYTELFRRSLNEPIAKIRKHLSVVIWHTDFKSFSTQTRSRYQSLLVASDLPKPVSAFIK